MARTFSANQTTIAASSSKDIYWEFKIVTTAPVTTYWSTRAISTADSSDSNAYTFKIIPSSFKGVTINRSKSDSGIQAPNDLSFTVTNANGGLTASDYPDAIVTVRMVMNDAVPTGKTVMRTWTFIVKTCMDYYKNLYFVCEDFLSRKLNGSWPNTKLVKDLFPSDDPEFPRLQDNACVPIPFGTGFFPLRSVYVEADADRFYLLGPSARDYSIHSVRSPRGRPKSIWKNISWNLSGSGTAEYYAVDAITGGDPCFAEQPARVLQNGVSSTEGTVGSLAADEWDYGDNDSLQFNTVYVRTTSDNDPDGLADNYVSVDFVFTQSTKTDVSGDTWDVFQPIIDDTSPSDGFADACGLWDNGSNFLDMPTKFSRDDTRDITGGHVLPTELMPNQVDRDFSGVSAWADVDLVSGGGAYNETGDLSITAGAIGDYCTLAVASAPTTIGKKYRMTYDVSGIVSSWTLKSFDGAQTIGTIDADILQGAFEWVATTTGGYRIVSVASDSSGNFDNFTLKILQCHDGGDSQSSLTDSTATWVADQLIGAYVVNETQGTYGLITDNTTTNVTASMSSGDWDDDDVYTIGGPASVLRFILSETTYGMGVDATYIDDVTFGGAEIIFAGWNLEFNGGYWFKEDRQKIIADLLLQMNATLVMTDKIELHVLTGVKAANSQATLTSADILKGTFRNTFTSKQVSDSGKVAFPVPGDSQEQLITYTVPAFSNTSYVSTRTVNTPMIYGFDVATRYAQNVACLSFQRVFDIHSTQSFKTKTTVLKIDADDTIYINDSSMYGPAFYCRVDSITYGKDGVLSFSTTRFANAGSDWGDLAFGNLTVGKDSIGNQNVSYSIVQSGNDGMTSDGAFQNALPGALRVGATSSYILLDPSVPVIKVVEDSNDLIILGDLGGGLPGLRGKDTSGNILFEIISGSTAPFVLNYADLQAIELELMKMNFQSISWAQFAVYDPLEDETLRADPDPSTYDAVLYQSKLTDGGDGTADRSFGFVSKTYTDITVVETGTSTSVGLNFLADTAKSWFTDECKNLTLIDSIAAEFTVTSNTSNTLTVAGSPTAGAYKLREDQPSYAVGFCSYSDSTNGGTGYVKMEVSFDNGGNWQVFLNTESSVDFINSTQVVANSGDDYIVRLTLKNDGAGDGPTVYNFLVCTDPSPWRW